MSISSGNYPDKLKTVKVIPTHKGGSTHDLNNFHPISLLSIFDKIINQIKSNHIFSKILYTIEKKKKNLNNNKIKIIIYTITKIMN